MRCIRGDEAPISYSYDVVCAIHALYSWGYMIKISTPKHTLFAAQHLVNQLAKINLEAQIVQEINTLDKDLYIIYQASPLYRLPKNYIVAQTEIAGSHWFNNNYRHTLKKAIAVWDYSEYNFTAYDHQRRCIVTPGLDPQPEIKKDISKLFYGWIKGSPRREKILNGMKDVLVHTNLTGPAMWSLLARTEEVINIHYYDHSPLELYRIYESISHGCKVWLYDEGIYFEGAKDNLNEVIHGIQFI